MLEEGNAGKYRFSSTKVGVNNMENCQNGGRLEVFGQPQMIDFHYTQAVILCKTLFLFLFLII